MPSLAFLDFCTTARCFPCVSEEVVRAVVGRHSSPRPRPPSDSDWMFPEEVQTPPEGPDHLEHLVLGLQAFQATVMELLQVAVGRVCMCVCGGYV